jgi:hypothetical protein
MASAFFPSLVYALCGVASTICALLVLRSWRATRQRLQLFIGASFVGLAVNNVMLIVDLVLLPSVDLALVRSITSLLASAGLLFALIWEARA